MKVPILTLDKPNKNGRVYPREVMEEVLEKYRKEFVNERRALVQKKLPETTTVSLLDSVGVVNEIFVEDDTVFVDVEFFPHLPEGLMFESAIKGGHLHLRTAGMGSMHKQDDGTYKVGTDYELISCFITDDPA